MLRRLSFLLLVALLGGCGETTSTATAPAKAAVAATDFSLPDLEGEQRSLQQWRGKVVMLNFWAPWCPPCRKEIPAFIELQEKYAARGFTIVGITLDTQENAQVFADTMGINYPVLIAEDKGIELAGNYGNTLGALPYTAIIDRQGHVVFTHRSELSLQQAESAISGLL